MSIWGATGLGAYDEVAKLLNNDRHLVAAKDRGGQTPLHIAAGCGHLSIVSGFCSMRAQTLMRGIAAQPHRCIWRPERAIWK